MYAVLLTSDEAATGEAHTVEFPEVLQNVNVQINPGENTAFEVEIHARLDDSLPWVTILTVDEEDAPADLLQELGSFPQYRAKLNSLTGDPADDVVVAISYAPAAGSVLATSQPTSELTHLNPPQEE